jgi:hypothetical protein
MLRSSVLVFVLVFALAVFCGANLVNLVPLLMARLALSAPEATRGGDCNGGKEHDTLEEPVLCAWSAPIVLIRVFHEASLSASGARGVPRRARHLRGRAIEIAAMGADTFRSCLRDSSRRLVGSIKMK